MLRHFGRGGVSLLGRVLCRNKLFNGAIYLLIWYGVHKERCYRNARFFTSVRQNPVLHTNKLIVAYKLQETITHAYIGIYQNMDCCLQKLIKNEIKIFACKRSPRLTIRALGLVGTSIQHPSWRT